MKLNLRQLNIRSAAAALWVVMSTPAYSADLSITISPVNQSKGEIRIAVFNSQETFQKEFYRAQPIEAVTGAVQHTFTDLPRGEYAVMVFHDVNGNKKLDANLLGLPSEPWGGSLQRSVNFRAPEWTDTRFELVDENLSLDIVLN